MQNSMVMGWPLGFVGSGTVDVHSPLRNGNFCCAVQASPAVRMIKHNASHFIKVTLPILLLSGIVHKPAGSGALLSIAKQHLNRQGWGHAWSSPAAQGKAKR